MNEIKSAKYTTHWKFSYSSNHSREERRLVQQSAIPVILLTRVYFY